MTRLERKEAELDKLYSYRAAASRRNDIVSYHRIQGRIDDIQKEIIGLRKEGQLKLGELLADREECVKNEIYKSLLRISLLADVVNEATERCRGVLKRYGVEDFQFRQKVVELCNLSQEVASMVLIPDAALLEDFIVNDDEVVDKCVTAADRYLKKKLKL